MDQQNPFMADADSLVHHLVPLAVYENAIVEGWLDTSLDSADVLALYQLIGKPEDGWIPAHPSDNVRYDDIMLLVSSEFHDTTLPLYFAEVLYFSDKLDSLLGALIVAEHSKEDIYSWYTAAVEHELAVASTTGILSARDGECQECLRQYDVCKRGVEANAAAIFTTGTMTSMGNIVYTGWSGPIAATAAGTTFFGGVVGAGVTYLFQSGTCTYGYTSCLTANDCPSAVTPGDPACGLPCVIPN